MVLLKMVQKTFFMMKRRKKERESERERERENGEKRDSLLRKWPVQVTPISIHASSRLVLPSQLYTECSVAERESEDFVDIGRERSICACNDTRLTKNCCLPSCHRLLNTVVY